MSVPSSKNHRHLISREERRGKSETWKIGGFRFASRRRWRDSKPWMDPGAEISCPSAAAPPFSSLSLWLPMAGWKSTTKRSAVGGSFGTFSTALATGNPARLIHASVDVSPSRKAIGGSTHHSFTRHRRRTSLLSISSRFHSSVVVSCDVFYDWSQGCRRARII
ncbi:hypothetical protein BHM03_00033063 [Ensete ventricosum]|nr:hypothetical protein BHM03_00033063 [Ensete ventricosum]